MRSGRTGRLGSDQQTSCASDILSTMCICFTETLTLAHTLPTCIMFKFQSGINPSTLTVEDVRWRGSVQPSNLSSRGVKRLLRISWQLSTRKNAVQQALLPRCRLEFIFAGKVPSFLQKVADGRRVLSTNKRTDLHNNVAFYVESKYPRRDSK